MITEQNCCFVASALVKVSLFCRWLMFRSVEPEWKLWRSPTLLETNKSEDTWTPADASTQVGHVHGRSSETGVSAVNQRTSLFFSQVLSMNLDVRWTLQRPASSSTAVKILVYRCLPVVHWSVAKATAGVCLVLLHCYMDSMVIFSSEWPNDLFEDLPQKLNLRTFLPGSCIEVPPQTPIPHSTCSVVGPAVLDVHGQLNFVEDRCSYALLSAPDLQIVATFQERRRKDVSFLDGLILQMGRSDVHINLDPGGRVRVSRRPSHCAREGAVDPVSLVVSPSCDAAEQPDDGPQQLRSDGLWRGDVQRPDRSHRPSVALQPHCNRLLQRWLCAAPPSG